MTIDQPAPEHFLSTLVQMVKLVTEYFHGGRSFNACVRALVLERLGDCGARLTSLACQIPIELWRKRFLRKLNSSVRRILNQLKNDAIHCDRVQILRQAYRQSTGASFG